MDTVSVLTEGLESALKGFLTANLFVSIFTAGMLQYLWSLINTLQIVVLTVLFQLDIPINAELIMIMILEMCSLEFIPTETVFGYMHSFRETQPFASKIDENGEDVSKFAAAGYENANYWQLLGPLFFIIVFFILLTVIKIICRRSVQSCNENYCTRRLRRPNKYGVIILRFLLEGCLEMGLSAMISIVMIEKESYGDYWEIFSLATAFITLFILAITPCYLKRISKEYSNQVTSGIDKKNSEHFELFEPYRTNSESLMYPVFFLMRRYQMILVLIVFPGYKYAQILSQFMATMLMIIHVWGSRPYDSLFLNRQELINEHMVLIAAYPLYCFTPWVWDIQRRIEAGWLIVFIILFNIFFNIMLLIYQMLKQAFLKLKYCYIKSNKRKKLKKDKEELQKKKEMADKRDKFMVSLFETKQISQSAEQQDYAALAIKAKPLVVSDKSKIQV